jgi:hypothetical protein
MNQIFGLTILVMSGIILNLSSGYFSQVGLLVGNYSHSEKPNNTNNYSQKSIHLNPYLIAARDDRIDDCLRSGKCKN